MCGAGGTDRGMPLVVWVSPHTNFHYNFIYHLHGKTLKFSSLFSIHSIYVTVLVSTHFHERFIIKLISIMNVFVVVLVAA